MASNLFDCPFALLSAHGILRQQLISRFRISSSLHSLSPDSTTIRPTILPSRVKRPIIVSFGRGTYGDGIIVSSFPEESVVSFRVIGPFNTLYSLRFFFFLCPLEQGGGRGRGERARKSDPVRSMCFPVGRGRARYLSRRLPLLHERAPVPASGITRRAFPGLGATYKLARDIFNGDK